MKQNRWMESVLSGTNTGHRFERRRSGKYLAVGCPGLVLGLVPCLVLGLVLGLASVVFAQAAPQTGTATPAATASGQRTDGQIEMDVVHALDGADQLKPDWITASTVQGVVTLSGISSNAANRELADSLSAKVPGVTKVVNNLTVGNPQQAQGNVQTGAESPATDPAAANNEPAPGGYGQAGEPGAAGNYPAGNPGDGAGGYQNGPPDGSQAGNQAGNQAGGNNRAGYEGGQGNGQPQPYRQQYPAGPEPPRNPVTLPQGTTLVVRTSQSVGTQMARAGTPVDFVVARDVYAGGVLAIPRGAAIHGEVIKAKQAGTLGGRPELALQLTAVQLEGNSYPLTAEPFYVRGPSKTGHTIGSAFGGALLGALVGGAFGGGGAALVGGAIGGVGGTAASAMTPGPQIWISSESMMTFHLDAPVTVTPVSRAEAQRLASASVPTRRGSGPVLYQRYPYGSPYGYGGYGFGGYYAAPLPPMGYYRPY